jgi:uncharacterized protein
MSEKFIPEYIDPFRYADQSLHLAGLVKMADMKRLSASLNATDDMVKAELQFGVDEQGVTFLKGHIEAKLSLQCQRCMDPFIYGIMSDFVLGVVNTLDEVNELSEHYEPALAKDGQLALRELIEDELILNLPIIPKHAPEDCKVTLPLVDSGWKEKKDANPFHVLESLKQKQQKSGE